MHTGLYKHFEEGERVHEIAYGYGMRMLDCAGPCPTMPGFDKAFARVAIAEQLADKDLSDFVMVGHPDPFQMGVAPGNVTIVYSATNFIDAERTITVTDHVAVSGLNCPGNNRQIQFF